MMTHRESVMQRLLALLVLTVAGWLPVAAGLSYAARAPQLAACCRAQGKHKCAMRGLQNPAADSSTETTIYSACDQYPVLPVVSSVAVHPSVCLPTAHALHFATLSGQTIAQAQIEALFRISFERSRQKRGPPTLL